MLCVLLVDFFLSLAVGFLLSALLFPPIPVRSCLILCL